MRFRTKVDWWIGVLVIGLPLVMIAVVAVSAATEGDWWLVPLTVGVYGLAALVCWPCDYTLMEDHLLVRSGLIKWRIPYAEIERVYPTRNPLSSPAWSLDRVAIVYGRRQVMVSPQDRDDFLTFLMARAGLRQTGRELARQAH